MKNVLIIFVWMNCAFAQVRAQETQSVARIWMELMLECIKVDGNGPTVQARNMYHTTAAMYDAWAVFQPSQETIFLGKTQGGFHIPFEGMEIPKNADSAANIAISYAAYRMISLRFEQYGSKTRTADQLAFQLEDLGLKPGFKSQDYQSGSAAALGNYIAYQLFELGLAEGAGDDDSYESNFVSPVNYWLKPNEPGCRGLKYVNRWQPLSLYDYIQKKGADPTLLDWNHQFVAGLDIFLTPHWGSMVPYAMSGKQKSILTRDGEEFPVYHDPGPPPAFERNDSLGREGYRWNFMIVALWGAQNDPNREDKIDISPASMGDSRGLLPSTLEEYKSFFKLEGGTPMNTYKKNPVTHEKYAPNLVKRGDYTRVIAEYWVDGINTYTPPGHWVSLLHYVSDHPDFEKKWAGKGDVLSDLEWDLRSYLALIGGLHDAAISAWGVKAYYDYVRPISAIRWLAVNGQCTDETLPNYNPNGIELKEGHIELVEENDPLAGANGEHVGKIKICTWKGPNYVKDVRNTYAGVGWILGENWWPYQQYSFTTPPFAGYVSGHSTFSTAASEVMTQITGNEFFPAGIYEETFKKNEFLRVEDGPSEDVTLQWATYRQMSDQTCLSRIYGGIHPPVDDIEGRKIGEQVGRDAFSFTDELFRTGKLPQR